MGIMQEIGSGPICLDTAIFIYFIEEHPTFLEIVLPIFQAIDDEKFTAITSGITLLETLVVPLRAMDFPLADKYEYLLTHTSGLLLYDINQTLLRKAAFLRSKYNIKTPDALQIATALSGNCSVFITNDRKLPKIDGIKIVQLSSNLPSSL